MPWPGTALTHGGCSQDEGGDALNTILGDGQERGEEKPAEKAAHLGALRPAGGVTRREK